VNDRKTVIRVSLGSVATYVRCGGMSTYHLYQISCWVWQWSYCHPKFGAWFFLEHGVHVDCVLFNLCSLGLCYCYLLLVQL